MPQTSGMAPRHPSLQARDPGVRLHSAPFTLSTPTHSCQSPLLSLLLALWLLNLPISPSFCRSSCKAPTPIPPSRPLPTTDCRQWHLEVWCACLSLMANGFTCCLKSLQGPLWCSRGVYITPHGLQGCPDPGPEAVLVGCIWQRPG